MNLNTVTFHGNLTDTPNLEITPHHDVPVAEAVVLVNRRIQVAAEQWEDAEPTRHRIKAWRRLAQNIATLPKGAEVLIVGHVETDSYTDKDTGNRRTSNFVVIDALGASLAHATVDITKNPKPDNTTPGAAS